MDSWLKEVNEQVEKLHYLEGKKEENMQILQKRIKEIEEEKRRKDHSQQRNMSPK